MRSPDFRLRARTFSRKTIGPLSRLSTRSLWNFQNLIGKRIRSIRRQAATGEWAITKPQNARIRTTLPVTAAWRDRKEPFATLWTFIVFLAITQRLSPG